MSVNSKLKMTLIYIFLGITTVVSVFPLLWMVIATTNKSVDVIGGKLTFGSFIAENYKNLVSQQPLWSSFFNSCKYTILGFRAFCDNYDDVLEFKSEQFRIADMPKGKAIDDGYRGIHVYYQKSGRHYPIEIQFNTLFDRQLNNWLHDYLYKKNYSVQIGKIMRNKYENGLIRNEDEFKEELKNVLSNC